MALSTRIKDLANSALRHVGLKVETLTSNRQEVRRLMRLVQNGYFDRPAFPLLSAMKEMDASRIFERIDAYKTRLVDLEDASRNPVGFSSDNDYFSSPDADVLYCIVRMYKPDTIVEVGCGHSTKISRLAIMDGKLDTRLITIDPSPRNNIEQFSDQYICRPVEDLEGSAPFSRLKENDILFIDSSHELKAGNDLVYLYLNVIPFLRQGVLIHIHDVFLPYDYRPDWLVDRGANYSEQYLVQAMVYAEEQFEVLWAGYYLQKSRPEFCKSFPHAMSGMAQSLWLRKLK